jgi:hypothetical protein
MPFRVYPPPSRGRFSCSRIAVAPSVKTSRKGTAETPFTSIRRGLNREWCRRSDEAHQQNHGRFKCSNGPNGVYNAGNRFRSLHRNRGSTPPASIYQRFRQVGTSREWEIFSAAGNQTSLGRTQSPAGGNLKTISIFQRSPPDGYRGAADFNGEVNQISFGNMRPLAHA